MDGGERKRTLSMADELLLKDFDITENVLMAMYVMAGF